VSSRCCTNAGAAGGNAGRSSANQGLIDDPIDKRAPGENTDWAKPWRSFQSWGAVLNANDRNADGQLTKDEYAVIERGGEDKPS
jgi:hypothetical protein